jgi:hypothetical protein
MGRKKRALKKIKEIEKRGLPELNNLNSKNPGIEGIPAFDEEIATRDNTIPLAPLPYRPDFPYRGKQIIIDSGRVMLNSKDDATFIVGNKAVSISSGGTINLDSDGKCIINSSAIDLGLEAIHPVIHGDTFVTVFTAFLQALDTTVCPQLADSRDSNNTIIGGANSAGLNLQKAVRSLAAVLPNINSQLVKTQ